MLYALLGRLVWRAGKLFLRRRYGRAGLPKSAVGAAAALAAAGAVALAKRRGG